MKRHIIFLFMLVLTLTAQAQLTSFQRPLGYTVTDKIDVSGAAFGSAGTYPVGALLEPRMLAGYEGCKIVGLRFALSQSIGRTRAFLYHINGSGLELVHAQNQRTYEGWNNVMFNGDGFPIEGNETIFFGFDYVETAEMVAAEEGALCGVGDDTEGAFMAWGNFGSGEGLYSLSNIGCLCVQLIVDISSLPSKDMRLTYFDTGFKYKTIDEKLNLFAMMSNTGRDSIQGYTMTWQIDQLQPVTFERRDTIVPGGQSSIDIDTALPSALAVGMHSLKFYVSDIDGQAALRSDTLRADFAIYGTPLMRQKSYIEVYTDANTYLSSLLYGSLESMEKQQQERVAIVCIHRKGTALNVPESDYLSGLYAYTYPSFTSNRSYFPNETYIAYDMNDYLPVVGSEFCAELLSDIVLQDYYMPAFAQVDLHPVYDPSTRQLSVSLDGRLSPDALPIFQQMALTVLLTENGVTSQQQTISPKTGRKTMTAGYSHPHVFRTFLTAPYGDALTPSGDTFSATYSTTLDAGWNADKIQLVAFVTKAVDKVTEDNLRDVDIVGANCMLLSEGEQLGIADASHQSSSADVPVVYTLDGKRLGTMGRKLPAGIYVVRQGDSSRKVVIK